MKILKYFFYLIILTFVSVCTYIATLETNFNLNNDFEVAVKKTQAQDYINDLNNWKEFIPSNKFDTVKSTLKSTNNERIILKLDTTFTNTSRFSVFITGNKIGELTYNFLDSLKTQTIIKTNFKGEVTFKNKFNIFLKGISPTYYFSKLLTKTNSTLAKQINLDFNFKEFSLSKIKPINKTYYYKSRYANFELTRENIIANYLDLKKQLDSKIILNNQFYIETYILEPKRIEYTIGIPVNNKLISLNSNDIYLDSIPAGKILVNSFKGNYAYEKEYFNWIKQKNNTKNFTLNPEQKINVWDANIKYADPKKWTFQTWEYFLPEPETLRDSINLKKQKKDTIQIQK